MEVPERFTVPSKNLPKPVEVVDHGKTRSARWYPGVYLIVADHTGVYVQTRQSTLATAPIESRELIACLSAAHHWHTYQKMTHEARLKA